MYTEDTGSDTAPSAFLSMSLGSRSPIHQLRSTVSSLVTNDKHCELHNSRLGHKVRRVRYTDSVSYTTGWKRPPTCCAKSRNTWKSTMWTRGVKLTHASPIFCNAFLPAGVWKCISDSLGAGNVGALAEKQQIPIRLWETKLGGEGHLKRIQQLYSTN